MPASSSLRNMSISQWKLLNRLREFLSKSSADKGFLVLLSNEWLNVLQKLPNVYNQMIDVATKRNFERINASAIESANTEKPRLKATVSLQSSSEKELKPQVSDVKLQARVPQVRKKPEESSPKWKPKREIISQVSINSRTKHVISSVATAESALSRLKRLEDLTNHLNQYPDAKNLAVKEGAIQMLLRLRRQTKDEATLCVIREACSILGFVDPLPGKGIRILSIDGGGIRGVMAIELLKRLEELTGKRVFEMFDYVCGVSTGAILLFVAVPQKKPLDELSTLYKDLSTQIFTQSALWGASNLVWSHSYYDTEMWEKLLKTYIGETPLIKTARDPLCPKLSAVSTVVNQAVLSAFLFRNYSLPYRVQSQYAGTSQYQLWQAVRASAAAPSYFEEYHLGDHLYQDGGILVNNPCAVAIHEAKQLWPRSPIQCVVSFGTGRFNPLPLASDQASVNSSSWKTKFFKILDSATDTEAVHTMLSDLLPKGVYYRFNPYLTEMVAMDEIRPDKVAQLEQDAAMYYRRNEETFQAAAKALTETATLTQKCHNWISAKRDLMGLRYT